MVHDTGRLLKISARQLTKNFDQFARKYDLTATQLSIIDHLARKSGEVLQRDLEEEFCIRRSTATLTLQRMEKKGLVERSTSKRDARQKAVNLTDKGIRLVDCITEYVNRQQRHLHSHFTDEEIKTFEKILHYYIGDYYE